MNREKETQEILKLLLWRTTFATLSAGNREFVLQRAAANGVDAEAIFAEFDADFCARWDADTERLKAEKATVK